MKRANKFSIEVATVYDPALHTPDDVYSACLTFFYMAGKDLPLDSEDVSDPTFVQYVSDHLAGLVPEDVWRVVKARLMNSKG